VPPRNTQLGCSPWKILSRSSLPYSCLVRLSRPSSRALPALRSAWLPPPSGFMRLHTPIQTTALIVGYGLLVQGYAVWKLRHNLDVARLVPLIVGSAIGVPFGILLLRWAAPANLRIAVGILLILFSLYNLVRPRLPSLA